MIARDLGRAGWLVGVHHRHAAAEAQEVVEGIRQDGGRAIALPADLCNPDDLARLIPACTEHLGAPTLLINNAALFEWDDIHTVTLESLQDHFDLNLRAPVFLAQAFAAALPDDERGSIVNIIDQRVLKLTPDFLSYTLSKSALWTATQTLAQALAPRIRVNAIGPGPTLASALQRPEQFERQRKATPLGTGASPEEICRAIRFILATPSMTGQMICLDGGQHLAWRTADADGLER